MAIEEHTFIREVLFARTAANAGWAAHQVPMTLTTGGARTREDYGPAEPLTVEAAGALVGAELVNVINERDALAALVPTYAETITEQAAEIARLTAIIEGASA